MDISIVIMKVLNNYQNCLQKGIKLEDRNLMP